MRNPFGVVLVEGPSMLPTLRPGDCLLVRRRARVRVGDVVVGRFRARPALLVVKRALAPAEGGWLLAGDNPAVEGQGLTRGVGDVEALVVLRWWPLPPRRLARAAVSWPAGPGVAGGGVA